MEVIIETNEDLINWLETENVPYGLMVEVVCKFLNIFIVFELTKPELIEATKKYVELYGDKECDKPLFLITE